MSLTLLEFIGQGGFGLVEKVVDENGAIFARKTFQVNQGPHFPKDLEENVKKRFIREAKTQEAIRHKNIVPVLQKNITADPPYFLMPLALSSLEKDIQKNKTLNGLYTEALLDIIAALEELHSMEMFHRDLKPANVLRFNENGEDYYAIGDFGLMSINQTKLSTLTQTGMRMESDYYTAPEIVKDLKNASAQSDIFSLGCILHDFVGQDVRIPNNEIKEGGDYGAILLSCTRRDPARRFKSVTALRDALLSLGDINIQAKSFKGAEIFEILEEDADKITEEEWKKTVSFVEDEYESEDAIAVLRKLTIQHLDVLTKHYNAIASDLGIVYAKWIREKGFNFEECDGLSIRLQKFIQNCGVEVKTECLMAMLYLGYNHNRYYVEKKFVSFVGKSMEENVAKRLAVEIRVDGEDACKAIRQLDHLYNYSKKDLHPLLVDTVKEICK